MLLKLAYDVAIICRGPVQCHYYELRQQAVSKGHPDAAVQQAAPVRGADGHHPAERPQGLRCLQAAASLPAAARAVRSRYFKGLQQLLIL